MFVFQPVRLASACSSSKPSQSDRNVGLSRRANPSAQSLLASRAPLGGAYLSTRDDRVLCPRGLSGSPVRSSRSSSSSQGPSFGSLDLPVPCKAYKSQQTELGSISTFSAFSVISGTRPSCQGKPSSIRRRQLVRILCSFLVYRSYLLKLFGKPAVLLT